MLYRLLFAAVFRRVDPERAHHLGFGAIRAAAAVPGEARALRSYYGPHDPALSVHALGLDFPGPWGEGGGVGQKPGGIDRRAGRGVGVVGGAVAARLARWRERQRRKGRTRGAGSPIVGVNLGKSKVVPEAEAIADYETSARLLAPLADYLVVNVSSPNTPGLRDLQAVSVLRPLLLAVRTAADTAAGRHVPLLVKIAPDLADQDIDAVAELAAEIGLDGIVATNTTIRRDGLAAPAREVEALGAGGLSGPVLRERALEVLRRLRARVGPEMTIIGVGGITTAEDAAERLAAGASLLQGYTGFIYQGPFWDARIQRGLMHAELGHRAQRQGDALTPGTGRRRPSGPGRREENVSR